MRFALILLLVPALAWGQPLPADEPPVVAVEQGDQAPYRGLCMTEARAAYFLGLDTRVVEAEGKNEALTKAIKTLEEQLAVEKTRQQSGGWGFWVGVGLGAAAVLGLVIAVK